MRAAGWACPSCGHLFARRDQPHSCHASNVARALAAVRPVLRPIMDRLLAVADDLPGARVESASGSFMVKAPATTFASFRPRAKDVQVSFKLDEELAVFPITKSLRLSAHCVAHAVHVDDMKDIGTQLPGWLQRAHALAKARPHKGKATGKRRG